MRKGIHLPTGDPPPSFNSSLETFALAAMSFHRSLNSQGRVVETGVLGCVTQHKPLGSGRHCCGLVSSRSYPTLELTDITGNGVRWARLQDSGAAVAFGSND